MHGKLSVEVNDHGLHFRGQSFSSEVGWSNFIQFFEDENSFVVYQNAHVFNLMPKRGLSSDQVATFRTYLERAIGRKA
jgi:YcxB-like protein